MVCDFIQSCCLSSRGQLSEGKRKVKWESSQGKLDDEEPCLSLGNWDLVGVTRLRYQTKHTWQLNKAQSFMRRECLVRVTCGEGQESSKFKGQMEAPVVFQEQRDARICVQRRESACLLGPNGRIQVEPRGQHPMSQTQRRSSALWIWDGEVVVNFPTAVLVVCSMWKSDFVI